MRTRKRGAREGCAGCGRPTSFEYDVIGPRGAHIKWLPLCVPCGEDVRKRNAALAKDAA